MKILIIITFLVTNVFSVQQKKTEKDIQLDFIAIMAKNIHYKRVENKNKLILLKNKENSGSLNKKEYKEIARLQNNDFILNFEINRIRRLAQKIGKDFVISDNEKIGFYYFNYKPGNELFIDVSKLSSKEKNNLNFLQKELNALANFTSNFKYRMLVKKGKVFKSKKTNWKNDPEKSLKSFIVWDIPDYILNNIDSKYDDIVEVYISYDTEKKKISIEPYIPIIYKFILDETKLNKKEKNKEIIFQNTLNNIMEYVSNRSYNMRLKNINGSYYLYIKNKEKKRWKNNPENSDLFILLGQMPIYLLKDINNLPKKGDTINVSIKYLKKEIYLVVKGVIQ